MAIVRAYSSNPDYFITFTCNPKWPEITSELFPHQTAVDRPDLTVRVFHIKLQELLDGLLNKTELGSRAQHRYSSEIIAAANTGEILYEISFTCLMLTELRSTAQHRYSSEIIATANTEEILYEVSFTCLMLTELGSRAQHRYSSEIIAAANTGEILYEIYVTMMLHYIIIVFMINVSKITLRAGGNTSIKVNKPI
ncbi:hypothetical protein K457DRAFT_1881241 [Linnemannia elongata AG-77]|uniref:Helitron helicase-like domain-containing protein n=1 Tax=Linnemannia elongata AG-77 TaxID=1314771 RepID=A0A197JEX5_9FUNG|nr:hypothetical protein K457DRAFT_1881241 [Linnemannia elongata AG-77]